MARSKRAVGGGARPRLGRTRSAARGARRMWPYMLMAWEHWQNLSAEDKERYKRQARGYVERGRAMLDAQRRGRPPG